MKKNNTKKQYVETSEKGMAITAKGLRLLAIGLLVMISGFIFMIGGGSDDPTIFNYDMFDFQRLVAAPVVIIAGIVIEVVAIMRVFKTE